MISSDTTDNSATMTGDIWDSVRSMIGEILALLIFFLTWTALSYVKKQKSTKPIGKVVGEGKSPRSKRDPDEMADQVMSLCQSQFTRALRLYREMVRTDQDKLVLREEFYTALVEAAVRVGQHDVAKQVGERMQQNGMVPSAAFLQSLLKLLAARKLYQQCVDAFELFQPEPDQVVFSCLTLASAELGDVEQTKAFLARNHKHFPVHSRDFIPLIRAYGRRKDHVSAVAELRKMMKMNIPVESVVFNSVLAICVHGLGLEGMRALISEMREYEKAFEPKTIDIVTYNTLMKALGRGRDLQICFSLLEEIAQEGIEPDDVTFSTLLDACMEEDHHELASLCLDRMCQSGVKMNCVLLTTLMKGFIRSRRLDKAMSLFESMRSANSHVSPDMITYSMLIKAQCDAHDMGKALEILEDMLQSQCEVDDVVFTHLIEGCCHVSNSALAEQLFADMLAADIKPSIYTLTGMVKVYGKCGQTEKARELVQTAEQTFGIRPTVVVHTCLISGMLRSRKYTEAFEQFQAMGPRGVQPDAQTVQTVVQGMVEGQLWDKLLEVVRGIDRTPVRTLQDSLNNALNQLLGRGEIQKARSLYKLLLERQVEVTVTAIRRRLAIDR